MNRKVVELSVTLLLVGVLIFLMVSAFGKKGLFPKKVLPVAPPPAASAGNVGAPGSGTSVIAIPFDESKARLQKEHATKPWGRDPFHRAKTAEVGYRTSTLELKGISIGADQKGYALINQEIVKEGDTIEGCEVLSIEKNRVLLRKGGQSFYLKLPEEQIEPSAQK